jgi:hypothetical protein
VTTIITTAEVVLQLCAELHRESLVLLERRIIAISAFAVPLPVAAARLLETNFPEGSERQMLRRLRIVMHILRQQEKGDREIEIQHTDPSRIPRTTIVRRRIRYAHELV